MRFWCVICVSFFFAACGAASNNSDGGGGSGGGVGTPIPHAQIDLCKGLVQDKDAHPMTQLAKPAVGATVTDAEFGTKIRRITDVGVQPTAANSALVPMYTTISAWNADESLLILYKVAGGAHQLYDGKTYKYLRDLDINPADIEQVYWHTTDPDILFYVDNKDFIRYHVGASTRETLTTFSFCSDGASGGGDPMFMSFDSKRIGLKCGDQVFVYDIPSNMVLGRKTLTQNPAQMAPSGTLAFLSDTGPVTDDMLNTVRTLDMKNPSEHASMGQLAAGQDTWNGVVYDPGPKGDDDIGTLVTFDLTSGTSRTIIGPKTGFPYPNDNHVSAMAYLQPGWMFVSTYGDVTGKGLLDLENVIADTNTGAFCRVGRHRSLGKSNATIGYFAEAHTVPSPSGTRAAFASDWGGGSTVDTYILELPSYTP
jgi:hypothetical protein